MLGGDKAQPAAPIETFARFQAFRRINGFLSILMVFHGSGVRKFGRAKTQPVAPIESFTRFQLAAIIDSSNIRFIGSGGWAGWLAVFSLIFIDFHEFS